MSGGADLPPGDNRPHRVGPEQAGDGLAIIHDCLAAGDTVQAARLLAGEHPSDVAQLLEQLDADGRAQVVDLLRPDFDAEILAYLPGDLRDELIEQLNPAELAAAVAELETDDAVDVIQDLDEQAQAEILANLPPEARALVEEGLTFPEYSAGRLMSRAFVSVPVFWTVGGLLDYLRAAAVSADSDVPEQFYDIIVVDPMLRVAGTVPLSRVLRAKRGVKLADILHEDVHRIPATMDQEEVARCFRKYGLVSAPVVDGAGRLLGVITVDDVVDVIEEEAEADLLALGGVEEGDLYRAVLDTTKSRFRWLAVNLVTAIVASLVIGLFEATIQQVVALAVLMPIVASMGGNAGTQTLTVAVRALATRELSQANALRVVGKEVLVGAANGTLFAVIAGGVAYAWFHDPLIGLVIAAAMVVNLLCAGLFGALIPLVLDRLKIDPAVASGVFLTTVTDVVGFLAFLGLASWVLT
ncbi:magnesium transporter [Oleisolibacter albus]|uniref:magnesium transporter n=1 Tax=Oleisolibacter albus TaxID=2171757 RepID=UPI000DF2CE4F|nr:magnesium transporter [Oleisolibacter albus]